MSKNTQTIENLISFDDLLLNCLKEPMRGFEKIWTYKTILMLSLTTGLEIRLILTLKWKDLLKLGSENDAVVKEELKFRNYLIPIHPKVQSQLSKIYAVLGFPILDSLIIEKIPDTEKSGYKWLRLPQYIICSISSNNIKFLHIDDKYLKKFNFEDSTQILFGRKVFEVCGYTNAISKMLKQHFELHLNKELFDALGYISKEEIKYELNKINLNANECLIKLEDKNFNGGYPFQKFTAFYKFLLSSKHFYDEPATSSIRLLLIMSLCNGIRPSTLVRLKWSDILQIDENEKTIEIRKFSILEEYPINIQEEIRINLLYHFELSINRMGNELGYIKDNKFKSSYITEPNLDTSVFIMNTDNPITQPSLSREIKKALHKMNFPHTDKITSKSTVIMYGRRIIEIKGDHKPTIKKLKEHFNFKSEKELFKFLNVLTHDKKEFQFKGKVRKTVFDEILYDL